VRRVNEISNLTLPLILEDFLLPSSTTEPSDSALQSQVLVFSLALPQPVFSLSS
jgi:hypothetical protein